MILSMWALMVTPFLRVCIFSFRCKDFGTSNVIRMNGSFSSGEACFGAAFFVLVAGCLVALGLGLLGFLEDFVVGAAAGAVVVGGGGGLSATFCTTAAS